MYLVTKDNVMGFLSINLDQVLGGFNYFDPIKFWN
jgi:hypothetical protein